MFMSKDPNAMITRLGEANRRGIGWEIRYERESDRFIAYIGNALVVRFDGVWKFYSVAAAQEAIQLSKKGK